MRRSGNAWILLIMVICGAVIGGLAAESCPRTVLQVDESRGQRRL